ncbi:hypothetical protein BC629DRAFT_965518 [Irpex lacteus]|nr:hypothetical protein BC629DRAFT_965518 [Irpex lacteus]
MHVVQSLQSRSRVPFSSLVLMTCLSNAMAIIWVKSPTTRAKLGSTKHILHSVSPCGTEGASYSTPVCEQLFLNLRLYNFLQRWANKMVGQNNPYHENIVWFPLCSGLFYPHIIQGHSVLRYLGYVLHQWRLKHSPLCGLDQ